MTPMSRLYLCVLVLAFSVGRPTASWAQATLTGYVYDPLGKALQDVEIVLTHEASRGAIHVRPTGEHGLFVVVVPPGRYRITVTDEAYRGFEAHVDLADGQTEGVSLYLTLRHKEDPITVQRDISVSSPQLRNGDGSLGATITGDDLDRPLSTSGRTLQSAACVTAAVTCTEQTGTGGEISLMGYRRDGNELRVDDVPHMDMPDPAIVVGPALNGAFPARGVDGSTRVVVPLDAIGGVVLRTAATLPVNRHSPGLQMTVVTKSGTDHVRGSSFADWRLDGATDYFDRRAGTPPPEVSLVNGGAALGGPLLPRRVHQYGVFEMEQLKRSVDRAISVPSFSAREKASPLLAEYLKIYPEPNGRDLGDGVAEHQGRFRADSELWTLSVRTDWQASSRHHLFSRLQFAKSQGDDVDSLRQEPPLSHTSEGSTSSRHVTTGLNIVHSPRLLQELRWNVGISSTALDDRTIRPFAFERVIAGLSPRDGWVGIFMGDVTPPFVGSGRSNESSQQQLFIADALTFQLGRNVVGVGAEYRESTTATDRGDYSLRFRFGTLQNKTQGSPALVTVDVLRPVRMRYRELSAYVQSTCPVSDRVSVFGGLRFLVRPPPISVNGLQPEVLDDRLQPRRAGEALWPTSIVAAPMVGARWRLRSMASWDTTLYVTAGRTYDAITTPAAAIGRGVPFASTFFLKSDLLQPLSIDLETPGQPTERVAIARELRSPHVDEFTIGLEQGVGPLRIGATYVKALGRDLIYPYQGFVGGRVEQRVSGFSNDGWSRSTAFTVHVRSQVKTLAADFKYTFSHAVDNNSGENTATLFGTPPPAPPAVVMPTSYVGPSNYSRPHVMMGTVAYTVKVWHGRRFIRQLLSEWRMDAGYRFQSSTPVTVVVEQDHGNGFHFYRADVVPGVIEWILDPRTPGGRRLNPDAFRPSSGPGHGTHGRNSVRGRGVGQVDVGLSRAFSVAGAHLELRVEVFNAMNTSNFAPPYVDNLMFPDDDFLRFGEPAMSFARGLGTGALPYGGRNPLRQTGGPRTAHASVRIRF